MPAYRDEFGVAKDSSTETYVALRTQVDLWLGRRAVFFARGNAYPAAPRKFASALKIDRCGECPPWKSKWTASANWLRSPTG